MQQMLNAAVAVYDGLQIKSILGPGLNQGHFALQADTLKTDLLRHVIPILTSRLHL